ncbi:Grasp55 grasp domain protein [Cryptosporidium felis]|nr:Grasp55 grasp domain protein [Cryptosporidium felis]
MGGAQTKQLGGFRVCNFKENSLGQLLGLEEYFDYIVGVDGVPLTQVSDASHDFFVKRLKGIGKFRVKISVYNSLSTRIRTIVLNPHKLLEKSECTAEETPRKVLLGNGVDPGKLEVDVPLNSLRVCQFLKLDDRISGLGIGVHWEEISTRGIKIVGVQNRSPAETSGLISNEDFIVGSRTLMRPFYSTDDFLVFIKNNDKNQVNLHIYNIEAESIREVTLVPDSDWGGKGLIGCDIAAGPLYDIPLREKDAAFQGPLPEGVTLIDLTSEDCPDGNFRFRLLKPSDLKISEPKLEDSSPSDSENLQNEPCPPPPEDCPMNKPRNDVFIKDNSFDNYNIRQLESEAPDEDIIKQALVSSDRAQFPESECENSSEKEDTKPNSVSNENSGSESFLIISNLNEPKEPKSRSESALNLGSCREQGHTQPTLSSGNILEIFSSSEELESMRPPQDQKPTSDETLPPAESPAHRRAAENSSPGPDADMQEKAGTRAATCGPPTGPPRPEEGQKGLQKTEEVKDTEKSPGELAEDVSPEDERAFEIFRKLVEISPRVAYEPPGTIEYVED